MQRVLALGAHLALLQRASASNATANATGAEEESNDVNGTEATS